MAHTHSYNILLRHSVVHHTRHSCVGYRDQSQPEYDNSIFVSGYGIESINQEKICFLDNDNVTYCNRKKNYDMCEEWDLVRI